jgi:hypothetical protein
MPVASSQALLASDGVLASADCCCAQAAPVPCQTINCVTFTWDIEYLEQDAWTNQQQEVWHRYEGSATVRCASGARRLVWLRLSSCFGTGATAIVTAPTGHLSTDMGPITAAVIDSPGSGYAKLGRVAPTLTLSGSGSGATFTPTLSASYDACGVPLWSIASVSCSGGEGYSNGELLSIGLGAGVQQPHSHADAYAYVIVHTEPRSEPPLVAEATTGSGATFTVATAATVDGYLRQGNPTWLVSAVLVDGETAGYVDKEPLTFSYPAGVTEQEAASARVRTVRAKPTVEATTLGGASLTVLLSSFHVSHLDQPTFGFGTLGDKLWRVSGVRVIDGGAGHSNGDPVTFTVTNGTQVTTASGTIVTGTGARENPLLTPYVWGFDGTTAGSGAVLSATMASNGGAPEETWRVDAITVVDGGSGYQVGEYFWYSQFGLGFDNVPPYYLVAIDGWFISSVDENGAITGVGKDEYFGGGAFYKQTVLDTGVVESVALTSGGGFYKDTGVIERVQVLDGGAYYYYTGTPTGCTVAGGGKYYKEDATLPPYVANVTAHIRQEAPSNGDGAAFAVAVGANPNDALTFGRVTGIAIANGGDGYLAVRTAHPDPYLMTCLNGNPVSAPPNFPLGNPGWDWQESNGPPGTHPVVFGVGGFWDCCATSFFTTSDFNEGMIVCPRGALGFEHTNVAEGIVTVRGTVTETFNEIDFAEDCECPNQFP